ncbi:hypothetical protein [Shouchella miscanthi]|uniref:CHAP domain-containing protein n=1 Tax=Shouchella miscanthi TaxID=2598861 RepID=A0ABU6NPS3_9BACI|nr:hypothetical protein [Shouchella miscanthi]
MKNLKFLLVFAFVLFFGFGSTIVLAEESALYTPEEYAEAQEQGIWESDITYEDYLDLYNENEKALQEMLEESESEDFVSINSSFVPKKGDILTTSSTIASGLTGHNGIVIDNNGTVLHIRGAGYTTEKISWSTWKSRYPKTRADRPSTSNLRNRAANYANDIIHPARPTYRITTTLNSINPTYCSKLVWLSYYKVDSASSLNWPREKGTVLPYSLRSEFKSITNVYNNM